VAGDNLAVWAARPLGTGHGLPCGDIGFGVDIKKISRVVGLKKMDPGRVLPDDPAAARIAGQALERFVKMAAENSGVAMLPVSERDADIFICAAESGQQGVDGGGCDQRLIAQKKHNGRVCVADFGKTQPQGAAETIGRPGIDGDIQARGNGSRPFCHQVKDRLVAVADNEDDPVEPGGQGCVNHLFNEGCSPGLDELLGPAEALRAAGGQDNPGDGYFIRHPAASVDRFPVSAVGMTG